MDTTSGASKVYERTENGSITHVSIREGLDEINHAQMVGKRDVKTMSSITRTDFAIEYKDGRKVRLVRVDAPAEKPAERTALIQRHADGNHYVGRVITARGKDYVVTPVIPAESQSTKHAPKGWIPKAYVTYWSVRNGERFGSTRTAGPDDKPGTIGRAIWDAANAPSA